MQYRDFLIHNWKPIDREIAANLIFSVLTEYGLECEPVGADTDVLRVEEAYWRSGGEFWIVEREGQILGTAGYYPIDRAPKAVEIRKMYLLPAASGQGLGRFLLQRLEDAIAAKGFEQIWIETASVLKEAVKLYESSGYEPTIGVETERCDRVYVKRLKFK